MVNIMAKNNTSAQKLLTIFLTMILIVSTVCVLIPGTKATELTPQQKAQTLTTEVLGIDTTKYDMHVETHENAPDYLNVVPRYIVAQTLTTDQNSVRLFYTFTNNGLQQLDIYSTLTFYSLTCMM